MFVVLTKKRRFRVLQRDVVRGFQNICHVAQQLRIPQVSKIIHLHNNRIDSFHLALDQKLYTCGEGFVRKIIHFHP